MAKKRSKQTALPRLGFPIVGIGASAGGLDALRRLLEAMPDKSGVALVIIQHLARDKQSLAPELLSKYTKMEVHQVHDEPTVQPNHVYIIPPGKYLSIVGGRLMLTKMEGPRRAPIAIDFFLRALAKDQQQRSVAVILSGTGNDGTLGVKAIKQAGGLVLAQNLDSAEHSGMPESAIASGVVDQVLSPEQIPAALVRFAEHDYIREETPPLVEQVEMDEASDTSNNPNSISEANVQPAGLSAIIDVLRKHSKRDFSSYKEATLLRRTRRRMCLLHVDSVDEYLDLLKANSSEIDALGADLLIGVTDFFRDRDVWEELASKVIPEIVQSKSTDEPIRAWVAGCATGEEAYTVAILFLDEIRKQRKSNRLQIFASDIDKIALQQARNGRYPISIEADVTPPLLKRYFSLDDAEHYFQVSKSLRESVVFAEQNLIGDPPFSQLDLVCCRNVMIYLKIEVQQQLLALFHFALIDGGHLLLGTAETVGRHDDLFETISKRHRIYRGIGTTRLDRLDLPITTGVSRYEIEPIPPGRRDMKLSHLTHQMLVDRMAPRAILIDRQYRILFISGDVNPYIMHKAGVPNDDLLGKLHDGLRSKLRGAVRKAFEEHSVVRVSCWVERDMQKHEIMIEASIVKQAGQQDELVLIVFVEPSEMPSDQLRLQHSQSPPNKSSMPKAIDHIDADIDDNAIIRQLEEELSATKDDLQTTIEQFAASNEEFKASNEEVMSINEELQSTNEELETSKEELQSLNEELSTVNLQLSSKVEELEIKHADLENLISATKVATICLDTDLAIRWFTPAAQQLVRIKPSDHGRPLGDLQNDFTNDNLLDECEQVLQHLRPVDNEVDCRDGRAYIRRVLPYLTEHQRIGGVVITLVDISARRKREQDLLASQAELQDLTKSLESQVEQRTELLEILQSITRVANEARTVENAVRSALGKIADYNGWRVGHVWVLDQKSSPPKQAMISSGIWHCDEATKSSIANLDDFQKLSQQMRCFRGEGIVGKVMETGEPQWIVDITKQPDTMRRKIPNLGLHAAIAFPITVKDEVVAVMEFLSDQVASRQERFMAIMSDIGIQLGHVIERKRLEQIVSTIAIEEQRRIGRELHDGIAQQLTGGALIAETLRRSLPPDSAIGLENVKHLTEILRQTHNDVRRLARGLMSETVDANDLIPILRGIAAEKSERYGISCVVDDAEYDESLLTSDSAAFTIVQVAREAIHNAVKHSNAPNITVKISMNEDFCLIVHDNGKGFEVSSDDPDNNGMRIMRYRAESVGGDLEVKSIPGDGSTVVLKIPARNCHD